MTSEQFVYIYCLKDPISLEVRYVGKSVNPDKRFKHHLLNANKRKYHSAQWINSLLLSNLKPIMEILEIANINNWKEKEMFWISNYNNLTNILPGGEGGCTRGRLGSTWSETQRINNKKARTGLKIKQTDINGLRAAKNRERANKRIKKVNQYDLNNNLIKEWNSLKDIQDQLKLNKNNIADCCRGKYKHAYNFNWKYKD